MVGAAIKTPTSSSAPPPAPKPRPVGSTGERAPRKGRLPAAVRILISVLIVWHFAAIILAAMFIPGPTSALVENIVQWRPVNWYLEALYLKQGHSFFAPNVGSGNVIHYECFDRNGKSVEQGDLPSRKEHWPRLLYHRYLMLASQSDGWGPDKQTQDARQRQYLDAYGKHLLRINPDAQSIRLQRWAHWPLPIDYLRPDRRTGYQRLSQDFTRQSGEQHRIDEQGYELLGETVVQRSQLEPEPSAQSADWQSYPANTASRQYGPWGVNR
jgi:hypothetical protein